MSTPERTTTTTSSTDEETQQKDVSPLTEITSAALARVGITDEEAAAILGDKSLMDDLREAQRRIAEAGEMAKDAESTLVDALISEGINMNDDAIKAMLKDIEVSAGAGINGKNASSAGEDDDDDEEGNDENRQNEIDEDEDEDDQEEFGNLIENLLKMSVAKDNSNNKKITSSSSQLLDAQLLPLLPLIAEFCGALPSLYSLTLVCQKWRGLLLSDSRAIQRTLWIAIACNEFPIEVSELGEDAFVDVVCWSDVVNKFVKDKARKTVRGSLTE